jgi:16S rRNA (guanine966-N2)-methyltransferase
MTRIIAGQYKGQRISVPQRGVRPTTDRVREAIFSALNARLLSWPEITVLDIFAGSGALGMEALSRGAASATFLEKDRENAAVISANLKKLGAVGEVIVTPAHNFQSSSWYSLVFLDPPFAIEDTYLIELLANLTKNISIGGLVLVERGKQHSFSWPIGYSQVLERGYGDSLIFLAERKDHL